MTLIDALTHVLNQPAPAVFETLLDAVLPALIEDPAFDTFPATFIKHVPVDGEPAWGRLLDRLLGQRSPDGWDINLVLGALNTNPAHAALGTVVWDRLGAQMNAKQVIEMLSVALRSDWADLVARLLVPPCPTDLSGTFAYHNPFNAVQSLDDLNRLLDLGFDPWQASRNGPTGYRLLSQRRANSCRQRRPDGRWTRRGAKEAMLKRLLANPQESMLNRVMAALTFHTEWAELVPLLNALGPAWLDVVPTGGGTVLHAVAVHRPWCMASVLHRSDVRARGLAWCQTPDLAGRHPWELVWLNHPAAQDPVHETRSVARLEAGLVEDPWTSDWLDGVPVRTGLHGLSLLLDAATAWKRPLPSFNHTPWWDWQVAHGGVPAEDAWALAVNDPDLLVRLDQLVWDVLYPRSAHYADTWFNLDLWSDVSHPWLATYRLMSSLLFLNPRSSPSTPEGELHRYHLDRAMRAIDEGADVPAVQRRLDEDRIGLDDERRKVWHRELCSAWEQRVLRQDTTPSRAVDTTPRRRL